MPPKVDEKSKSWKMLKKNTYRQGVSQRLAQELLRHSDPRLTSNLYTDAAHLPTFDAIENMPWLHSEETKESPLIGPPVVPCSVDLSSHFLSSADIDGIVEFELPSIIDQHPDHLGL